MLIAEDIVLSSAQVLKTLLSQAIDLLDNGDKVLYWEIHAIYRAIPALLFLLGKDEKQSERIFKGKKHLRLERCLKFNKVYPVLPLYGDLHIVSTHRKRLSRCA